MTGCLVTVETNTVCIGNKQDTSGSVTSLDTCKSDGCMNGHNQIEDGYEFCMYSTQCSFDTQERSEAIASSAPCCSKAITCDVTTTLIGSTLFRYSSTCDPSTSLDGETIIDLSKTSDYLDSSTKQCDDSNSNKEWIWKSASVCTGSYDSFSTSKVQFVDTDEAHLDCLSFCKSGGYDACVFNSMFGECSAYYSSECSNGYTETTGQNLWVCEEPTSPYSVDNYNAICGKWYIRALNGILCFVFLLLMVFSGINCFKAKSDRLIKHMNQLVCFNSLVHFIITLLIALCIINDSTNDKITIYFLIMALFTHIWSYTAPLFSFGDVLYVFQRLFFRSKFIRSHIIHVRNYEIEATMIISHIALALVIAILLIIRIFSFSYSDSIILLRIVAAAVLIGLIFIVFFEKHLFFSGCTYLQHYLTTKRKRGIPRDNPNNPLKSKQSISMLVYSKRIFIICSLLFVSFALILILAAIDRQIYNNIAMALDIIIRLIDLILLLLVYKVYKNEYKNLLYPPNK